MSIQHTFVCSRDLKQESAVKSSKNKEKSMLEEKKNQKWDNWEREKENKDEIKKKINLNSEYKYCKMRFEKFLSEFFMFLTTFIFVITAISIFILHTLKSFFQDFSLIHCLKYQKSAYTVV